MLVIHFMLHFHNSNVVFIQVYFTKVHGGLQQESDPEAPEEPRVQPWNEV